MTKQTDRLYAYLKKHGPIDSMVAIRELGIMALSQRVTDLRRRGVNISTRMKRIKTRYGTEARVGEYRLA